MKNSLTNKIIIIITILTVIFLMQIQSFAVSTSEFFNDNYWEWHVRTTTNDQAYNGKHIKIGDNKIDFYGYGVVSYKDYLFKDYNFAGEKIFKFQLDETKGNYHTLDGAGFIFNAKESNGKISGDVLLINERNIMIYRLENVDINTFETSPSSSVQNYAKEQLASVAKPNTLIHNLVITTSPTKVTVLDNGVQVLSQNLNYANHAGEGFGLLVSYLQHNCSILTQIEFKDFSLEIKDYEIPVYDNDKKDSSALQGGSFEIKNSNGEVVRTGTTDVSGKYIIKGLTEGTYTIKQTKQPEGYRIDSNEYQFYVSSEGKVFNADKQKETILKIFNEKIVAKDATITNLVDKTTNEIQKTSIALLDENNKPIKDALGNDVVLTTDENGKVNFANAVDLVPGTYHYTEQSVSDKYEQNSEIYEFVVDKDGNVTFTNNNGIIYNKNKELEQTQPVKSEEDENKNDSKDKSTKDKSSKDKSSKDETKKQDGILPFAGSGMYVFSTISILSIIEGIAYLRYRKMRY